MMKIIYSMTKTAPRLDLLQGTLDLLILRTLLSGPSHGHAVGHAIRHLSGELLHVQTGSLYPALHRLEANGFIASEWRLSEKGKRAKYYSLTSKGRTQLRSEHSRWDQLSEAIARVLNGPL